MATVTSVTIAWPARAVTHAERVATTRATITLSARRTSSSKAGATTVVDNAGRTAVTRAKAARAHSMLVRRIDRCIGPTAVRRDPARAFIRRPAQVAARRRAAGR